MFQRLRVGYFVLIVVAAIQFSLVFTLGRYEIVNYLQTANLQRLLVPIGTLFPLIWIGAVTAKVVWRRSERPSRAIWKMIKRERHWLLRGAFFAAVVVLVARGFSSYKTAIPLINPFWADPMLADLDRAVFGVDPWRITHSLFGPYVTTVIDRAYALWFMMMFILLGWFCFTRDTKLQIRGLLTYVLSWGLLGSITATVFASVGPCFYEEFYGLDRFAPMVDHLKLMSKDYPLWATIGMEYLLESQGLDIPGAGISAMPSMHVTIATLFALVAFSYSKLWSVRILASVYAVIIMVGSVHLGWHYVSDGVVGIVVVSFIWWATGRFVDWLDAREQSQREPAPELTPRPATS